MTVQHKPFAITLDVGSSHLNKTGSWRSMRPVYVDRLPPCNKAVFAIIHVKAAVIGGSWIYLLVLTR